MANEIKMPQLSDTMSSGKIIVWKKNEGDTVTRGDILAEVETDKANLEIESFQSGILLKVLVPAGSVGKVGEVIAVIGQPGEKVTSPAETTASPSTPAAQQNPPPATPQASPLQPTAPKTAGPATRPGPLQPQATVTAQTSTCTSHLTVVQGNDRVKASPLAKKVAEQLNVNLSSVHGSGPNGRIIKRDVEAAAGDESGNAVVAPIQPALESSVSSPKAAPSGPVQGKSTTMSRMRETIARRMQESVTQAPHFYVTTSVNMKEAIRLREHLKALPAYKGISINHLVIKAVGYGLEKEPKVNYSVKDGQIFAPDQINIGIITAIDDGLLIPVVREVNKLSLKDLVFESRAAIERARAGRPSSSDLSGGTFSISNMGMFDVENFTAIINPGQGGILAVSAVKETPIVENGAITVGSVMKVTLSVDHRIIDGVMGSTFLKHFKEALELPAIMLA